MHLQYSASVLYFLVLAVSVGGHCIHDSIALSEENLGTVTASKAKVLERDGKVLQAPREPIRIKYFFNTSYTCSDASGEPTPCWCSTAGETYHPLSSAHRLVCRYDNILTAAKKQFIQSALDRAIAYIESTFSVDRYTEPLKATSECGPAGGGVTIPPLHQNDGIVDADLVLYVTALEPQADIFRSRTKVWALACATDDDDHRPNIGLVNFNPYLFNSDATFDQMELDTSTAIHEIFHIMGFSASFLSTTGRFASWFGGPGVRRKGSNNEIVLPGVVTAARKHFNCPTLVGLALENQGGNGTKGSHWDKKVMGYEVMTGAVTFGTKNVVSELTLAFFEETGVYLVDFSKAEPLYWGKNKGCDFADPASTSCPNTDEFCHTDSSGVRWTRETAAYSTKHCGMEIPNCVPGKCSPTLTGSGFCGITTHPAGTIPSEFVHYGDSTVGGFSIYTDFCPVGVVPEVWMGRSGPCRSGPPSCDGKSLLECGPSSLCIWNGGTCHVSASFLYGQTYGLTSRCFETNTIIKKGYVRKGNFPVVSCHKTRCDKVSRTYTVEFYPQEVLQCQDGANVSSSNYNGRLTCWDYADICEGRGGVIQDQELPETSEASCSVVEGGEEIDYTFNNGPYPNNALECWKAACNNTGVLQFSFFDLESGYDYVSLQNGSTSHTGSLTFVPSFPFRGSLDVVFTSDGQVTGRGFRANVVCYEGCENPFFNKTDGHLDVCTVECPCEEGEGDCDSDAECKAGLVCSHNVGLKYGVALEIDVCEDPSTVANDTEECVEVGNQSSIRFSSVLEEDHIQPGEACWIVSCPFGGSLRWNYGRIRYPDVLSIGETDYNYHPYNVPLGTSGDLVRFVSNSSPSANFEYYVNCNGTSIDMTEMPPSVPVTQSPSSSGTCLKVNLVQHFSVLEHLEYENNEDVCWEAECPKGGWVVFDVFSTEEGYDWLEVGGKNYSGDSLPSRRSFTTLHMRFKSDKGVKGRGFRATFVCQY